MMPSAFDPDELIRQFESASRKGSAQLRKSVSDATLQALQGRELSLKNIRAALGSVTEAVNGGLGKAGLPAMQAEDLLDKAVAGMDDALVKAVEANRVALERLTAQGADLRDKTLAKALADLDKIEDSLIAAVGKAADGGAPLASAWAPVLDKLNAGGTASGLRAADVSERLQSQMADGLKAMRSTRAAGLRAAQALAESYTAMVSGVLMGMTDAMRPAAAKAEAPAAPAKKAARKSR